MGKMNDEGQELKVERQMLKVESRKRIEGRKDERGKNIPQALSIQNLRDVFPCLPVYLFPRPLAYNCDVQFGQRLALIEIVVIQ